MDFVSELPCIVELFLGELLALRTETLGTMFGFQLTPPDLGDCE